MTPDTAAAPTADAPRDHLIYNTRDKEWWLEPYYGQTASATRAALYTRSDALWRAGFGIDLKAYHKDDPFVRAAIESESAATRPPTETPAPATTPTEESPARNVKIWSLVRSKWFCAPGEGMTSRDADAGFFTSAEAAALKKRLRDDIALIDVMDINYVPLDAVADQPAPIPTPAAEPADWLVWSNEHDAWWRPKAEGYTTQVEHAGRFTKAEAEDHCNTRSFTACGKPSEEMVHVSDYRVSGCEAVPHGTTAKLATTECELAAANKLLEIYRDQYVHRNDLTAQKAETERFERKFEYLTGEVEKLTAELAKASRPLPGSLRLCYADNDRAIEMGELAKYKQRFLWLSDPANRFSYEIRANGNVVCDVGLWGAICGDLFTAVGKAMERQAQEKVRSL